MHRPLIPCILGLLACAACRSEPGRALPKLMDVSGDDCTASLLVYDRPPSDAPGADPGVPFINDGCAGDRIFLGIDGARRELTRARDLPLGEGGAYSDGAYRVLVERGKAAYHHGEPCSPGAPCESEEAGVTAYEARVRISSPSGTWVVDGTLLDSGPY